MSHKIELAAALERKTLLMQRFAAHLQGNELDECKSLAIRMRCENEYIEQRLAEAMRPPHLRITS
jgi:hypothetical protein